MLKIPSFTSIVGSVVGIGPRQLEPSNLKTLRRGMGNQLSKLRASTGTFRLSEVERAASPRAQRPGSRKMGGLESKIERGSSGISWIETIISRFK